MHSPLVHADMHRQDMALPSVTSVTCVVTMGWSDHATGAFTTSVCRYMKVTPQYCACIGGGPSPSGQTAPAQQASTGVNEAQPTTSLQIRLADGSKLTGRFNLTQTVQDIKR